MYLTLAKKIPPRRSCCPMRFPAEGVGFACQRCLRAKARACCAAAASVRLVRTRWARRLVRAAKFVGWACAGVVGLVAGVVGLLAGVYQLAGGPPWPTSPEVEPGLPSDSYPFAVPFVVHNKSALFSINHPDTTCIIVKTETEQHIIINSVTSSTVESKHNPENTTFGLI
jgi:hypothetical protein